MTHNGRGATNWGEAKNATASNRDNIPERNFSLASRVLDRMVRTRCSSATVFFEFRWTPFPTEVPFGSRAVETTGGLLPLPLRTNQIVLAITVGIVCLGETSIHWRKTNQSALTGREIKTGNSVSCLQHLIALGPWPV
jgi:hypothetical protein